MTAYDSQVYELRIHGRLDAHWSDWFGDLHLEQHADGTSTLTGMVADQAQLHGILARLRDLGVTLISCRALGRGTPTSAP